MTSKFFTLIFTLRLDGYSLLCLQAQVSLGLHYPKATPTPSGGNPPTHPFIRPPTRPPTRQPPTNTNKHLQPTHPNNIIDAITAHVETELRVARKARGLRAERRSVCCGGANEEYTQLWCKCPCVKAKPKPISCQNAWKVGEGYILVKWIILLRSSTWRRGGEQAAKEGSSSQQCSCEGYARTGCPHWMPRTYTHARNIHIPTRHSCVGARWLKTAQIA